MRLLPATAALCALIGFSAFADDPVRATAKVETAKNEDAHAAKSDTKSDTNRDVKPDAVESDAATSDANSEATKIGAVGVAKSDAKRDVKSDAANSDATKSDVTKSDASKSPAVDVVKSDAVKSDTVEPVKPNDPPVIVPQRPLSDTSASAEERAKLVPDDSDAALDRELGLSPKSSDAEAAEPDALGVQLIKTLLMLGLVVALIYLVLNFGLRRLMGIKSGALGGRSGVVDVIERVPLEQRRTLFVLKAAGEYLLVGTSEGGMTLISKLDTAEVERIQRERGSAQVQLSPFLQKLLSGQKKRGTPPQA